MRIEAMLSPTFIIGSIHIGTVQNASSVSIGNNWLSGFRSVSKSTQGIGTLYGDKNTIQSVRTLVYDPDTLSERTVSFPELPNWLTGWLANRENEPYSPSSPLS
ncbi:hypothetical protein D2Q93_02245 [Alicyclobacillaceae bacterium I2511]|nr:hypothetical protein D2Q93_02245 [Alicyclobacillaceae bacterium I2511]